MKKKMIIGISVVFALVFVISGIIVAINYSRREVIELKSYQDSVEEGRDNQTLISFTESREEAEELAQLYGITLQSYGQGVAVYETGEEPQEVISRGEKLGYPKLYLNMTMKALDE